MAVAVLARAHRSPSSPQQQFSNPRRPGRQARGKPPAAVAAVADVQLWVPTRLDVTLPLTDALWLRKAFPDAQALEAFVSTALVMAVAEARKGGDE